MASTKIERYLYGDTVHILHDPDAKGSSPRYKLMNEDGTIKSKPKGVTTILGSVLAKDFVGWALDSMEAELKPLVPSISLEDLAHAKLASTRKRDSGASTGSEAHAMVEHYLKTKTGYDVSSNSPEATRAYQAFVEWFKQAEPTVLNVEEVIYSETWEFAGTYDCMLEIDGKVYLCDLKTTNASRKAPRGVYAEYFIQLGAYALAHQEQREHDLKHGNTTKLVNIDDLMVISARKDGKLDIITGEDLGISIDTAKYMAMQVVSLYQFLTNTTRALGGR